MRKRLTSPLAGCFTDTERCCIMMSHQVEGTPSHPVPPSGTHCSDVTPNPPTPTVNPTDSVSRAHAAEHGSLVLACQRTYKQNQVIGFSQMQEVLNLDLLFFFSGVCVAGLGAPVCRSVWREAWISSEPSTELSQPIYSRGSRPHKRPAQEQATRHGGGGQINHACTHAPRKQ